MQKPIISVIIPTYNAEKYLRLTLDSVLAQTEPSWELIVVDDGSKDATLDIVSEYVARDARIRLVTQRNAGPPHAHNRGFAETTPTSQYLIFLDHDDVWLPHTLQTLRQTLEARPEAVGAHGLATFIDSAGKPIAVPLIDKQIRERLTVENGQVVSRPDAENTTFAMLVTRQCIATPGVALLRRTALAQAGLFSPDRYIADWDLWIRMSRQGPFAFVGSELILYRQHDTSMSKQGDRMETESFAIWRLAVSDPGNTPAQRVAAVASWRYGHKALGYDRLCWARWAIRNRQPVNALKQLRHAAIRYLEYFHVPASLKAQAVSPKIK